MDPDPEILIPKFASKLTAEDFYERKNWNGKTSVFQIAPRRLWRSGVNRM